MWPYMYSHLIQTKKEDIQNRQSVQMVQTTDSSAVTDRAIPETGKHGKPCSVVRLDGSKAIRIRNRIV